MLRKIQFAEAARNESGAFKNGHALCPTQGSTFHPQVKEAPELWRITASFCPTLSIRVSLTSHRLFILPLLTFVHSQVREESREENESNGQNIQQKADG